MDWSSYLTNEGGWAVCALLVAWFFRALVIKEEPDFVLGREYRKLQEEMKELAAKFESASSKQSEASEHERQALLERINKQAERLDRQANMFEQAFGRRLPEDP